MLKQLKFNKIDKDYKRRGTYILQSVFIIQNGVLLVSQNFRSDHSLGTDMQLVSGFISAIQSFSRELTGSAVKTINFENFTFHFYKDPDYENLLYVMVTKIDYELKEIRCKILKIASVFSKAYSGKIDSFDGDVTKFDDFSEKLLDMKIGQKGCGKDNCMECPYNDSYSKLIRDFKGEKETTISLLNDLLSELLKEVPDLLAALIIDLNGYVLTKQSDENFNEDIIGSIMSVVEPTINKIKKYAETSFGSGTFDTDKFRLFYLELGGRIPALFVLVSDPYSNIDNFVPYYYIVAEKISLLLNNRETSIKIPKLLEDGRIELKRESESGISQNILNQIFMVGPEKVGKSSLLEMYVNGNYIEEYKPTIGLSIIRKELQVTKRMKMSFIIFDMGGLKNFVKVRKFYYKILTPKAVLVMFDYSNRKTLSSINEYIEEARYFINDEEVPFVLIGNKIDKVEDREELKKEAEEIAEQYNCFFYETSALTGQGIDELFMHIASLG